MAYGDVRLLPENDLARKIASVDAEEDSEEDDGNYRKDGSQEAVGAMMTKVTEKPIQDVGMNIADRNPVPQATYKRTNKTC